MRASAGIHETSTWSRRLRAYIGNRTLHHADAALYHAKEHGRHQVHVYTDEEPS